jgi:hypothetical protein
MTKINHFSVVKQPFKYLECYTQTVLALLLYCFAIENTVTYVYSGSVCMKYDISNVYNRIGDVIVSVLDSSVVDRGFEPRSDQTKD